MEARELKAVRKAIAVILSFVLLLSLCGPISAEFKGYTDVTEDAWYYDDVMAVSSAGIMNGTDETHFSPNMSLNRAMMATVLWRLAGSPSGFTNSFTDVPAGTYYCNAVSWAQSVELINGVGNNIWIL